MIPIYVNNLHQKATECLYRPVRTADEILWDGPSTASKIIQDFCGIESFGVFDDLKPQVEKNKADGFEIYTDTYSKPYLSREMPDIEFRSAESEIHTLQLHKSQFEIEEFKKSVSIGAKSLHKTILNSKNMVIFEN